MEAAGLVAITARRNGRHGGARGVKLALLFNPRHVDQPVVYGYLAGGFGSVAPLQLAQRVGFSGWYFFPSVVQTLPDHLGRTRKGE